MKYTHPPFWQKGQFAKSKFWDSIVVMPSGCWESTMSNGNRDELGRLRIWWKKKRYMVSRVMYEAAKGQIPEGLFVCHSCDNHRCVNPCHLFLGTPKENSVDASRKNRMWHKIEPDQVREMRRLWTEGFTQARLAQMFGVHAAHVSRIVRRLQRPQVE